MERQRVKQTEREVGHCPLTTEVGYCNNDADFFAGPKAGKRERVCLLRTSIFCWFVFLSVCFDLGLLVWFLFPFAVFFVEFFFYTVEPCGVFFAIYESNARHINSKTRTFVQEMTH